MIYRRSKQSDKKDIVELAVLFCDELGVNNCQVLTHINDDLTILTVAEKDGVIVGVLGFIKHGTAAIGEIFYVDKDHRNSRAAYRLLKESESLAKSVNCDVVRIITKDGRDNIYSKRGYKKAAIIVEKSL